MGLTHGFFSSSDTSPTTTPPVKPNNSSRYIITFPPVATTNETVALHLDAQRPYYHALGLHLAATDPATTTIINDYKEESPLWNPDKTLRIIARLYCPDRESWQKSADTISHLPPGVTVVLQLAHHPRNDLHHEILYIHDSNGVALCTGAPYSKETEEEEES